ncbi:hypothetical protein [Lentzea flava]|uniref:Uncharacterized protein n=1 Tax=Lentzea flava TaxID=103732 RepID=A0ABQ2UK94_9PSEU|nr:hypothetical protein [Lentzea flava]MCP2199059.1 hypothetical protein [Lentzea flava]GGU34791.1 hypothetical protein GCM10010178_28890 [Lentzea flava]
MTDAPIVVPLSPDVAVVIEQNRVYFSRLVAGAPVDSPVFGTPLAAVLLVQPGELRKELKYKIDQRDGLRTKVALPPGPAVWIRYKEDIFVPTPDPRRLAAEIERRRRRVARYGGLAAPEVWKINPKLRVTGPHGFEPGGAEFAPARPDKAKWEALTPGPVGEPSPGRPPSAPVVPSSVPYPESLPVITETLATGVRFSVSVRRTFLGYEPVPAGLVTETPPVSSLHVPLAAWHVVQAGTLRGGLAPIRWCAADGRTEIRMDLSDGPALWLWGPLREWVVATPRAAELAEEIRLRQAVGMMFPLSSDLGAERRTWLDLPTTRPVDTPSGRALPGVPEWAPVSPTLVPPGCWITND